MLRQRGFPTGHGSREMAMQEEWGTSGTSAADLVSKGSHPPCLLACISLYYVCSLPHCFLDTQGF